MKEERSQRARRRAEATLRSGKFVCGPVQPPRGCRYGGTKMVEGIKTAVLDVTYCPSGSANCPRRFHRNYYFRWKILQVMNEVPRHRRPRHPRIAIKLFATEETA